MKTHYLSLSRPMVLAILAGAKHCTRRLVSRDNSLVDGYTCDAKRWATLEWDKAWPEPSADYWKVPCTFNKFGERVDTVHRVYPKIEPGDEIAWREQTERDDSWPVYSADRVPVRGYPAWRKSTGSQYRVDSLSPRHMPHAWCRLRSRVVSCTPSTPGDVTTPEEARAEGLVEMDCGAGPGEPYCWGVRGMGQWIRDDTPADAFLALLRELHGRDVDPSAPCWRIAFGAAVSG